MQKYKIFIQTNRKQLFGARIAKFAIEKYVSKPIDICILNVNEFITFRSFAGTRYLFTAHEERVYNPADLQSFTLSRFMPPEQMGFAGRAVVIDPDIFARTDIWQLLEKDMNGHAILACRKKDAWDSSVMLLDCEKLRHWKIEVILKRLANYKYDYTTIMTLRNEDVGELSRDWNSLDKLSEETKMLHTTGRLTQPWKTGLPIDFTRNKMPELFGIIPRESIHKLLGRYPTHYLPHPEENIERFFFDLVREAVAAGAISIADIKTEMAQGNIRGDFLKISSTNVNPL